MEIALNKDGPGTERQLAIIDKNRDLYLRTVRQVGAPKIVKLCKFFFLFSHLPFFINRYC